MSAEHTDTPPRQGSLERFSLWMGRAVPDAITASVIFLFIVAAAALAIGTPGRTVMDAYYRGLWMLLPFTMQMTLVILLGSALSTSPLIRRIVGSVARLPDLGRGRGERCRAIGRCGVVSALGARLCGHADDCGVPRDGSGKEGNRGGLSVSARSGVRRRRDMAVRAFRERAAGRRHAGPLPRKQHRSHTAAQHDLVARRDLSGRGVYALLHPSGPLGHAAGT